MLKLGMTQLKSGRFTAAHDTFFREAFSDITLAREFLQQWLPADILSQVDLSHLKALQTSQISQALGGTEAVADLLFESRFADRPALFYILIEHKSYADKFVSLQAHVYQAAAWWHYHRQHPRKKLPLIVTLVVHHAKSPFPYSVDLRDLIDAPPALVDRYVLKPFQLIDLAALPDEALQGSAALQAVELVMKHIRDKNLMQFMDQKLPSLLSPLLQQDEELALALLKYVMDAGNLESIDQLVAVVQRSARAAPPNLEERVMTLGERLRQEGFLTGRQEGLLAGRLEERVAMARRLLGDGLDITFICRATQLAPAEVVALQVNHSVSPVNQLSDNA